jgi:acetyl-CoA carboxylase carboxyl transferase subunit beta
MSWYEKLLTSKIRTEAATKGTVPEGLWTKCPGCRAILYNAELERNFNVCPKCNHHLRISARHRIDMFLDEDGRVEIGKGLKPTDPLKFKDSKKYKDRISQAQKKTLEEDALVVVHGKLHEEGIVVAAFDFGFMGGSMGSVVGEKIARAADHALKNNIPFLMISKSGGARMMEAALSLMQLAKTSAKLAQLADAGIPYISLCTDPTTGGTTASFAMLGDINISEPGALVAFAGPRVVRDTTGKELPEGFQTSEFLLEHGFLDFITHRKDLKNKVHQYIDLVTHQPLRT